MKSYLRKVISHTDTIIDGTVGEVVGSRNVRTYRVVAYSQQFIFLYRNILNMLCDLNKGELSVFIYLSFDMDIDKYTFVSNKILADSACDVLGISAKTFFNCISVLQKKGLIIRDNTYKNVYRIHPDYGWKGNQEGRMKSLHFILSQKLEDGDTTVLMDDANMKGMKFVSTYSGVEGFKNKGGRPSNKKLNK